MATKKSKKKTRKVSDCDGVQELKAIAAKIKDISLPAGSPASVKTRLEKMSARLIVQADNIQKALVRSHGSIERTAVKAKRLKERIAKDQAALEALKS